MSVKFRDIPKKIFNGNYRCSVAWESLKDHLERYQTMRTAPLDMDPEFQRGHVWTEAQQIAYIEFKLSGGCEANVILFNCPGWQRDFQGPFQLVDGKQRLTAALRFLNDEIPAFGHYISEYEDMLPYSVEFIFVVNNLPTEREVLQWYLELNSGGTPHTQEELDRVREMLAAKETMRNMQRERQKPLA